MGGKSGGGARTPYEAPNTLSSAQVLNIIDIVSEGEIAGFPDNAHPLKYVYFNDTPVQNGDGSFNFKGVTLYAQRSVPDQSYVPGFDASERTVAVSARVKNAAPVVRTVSDALVSRLRVTVGVERNAQVLDNGDTVAARTSLTVTLAGKSGSVSQTVLFNEKGSGLYYQDAEFAKLPAAPFTVRVSRDTADSTSDKVSNNTYFASYVEIVDAKLSYPNTAFAALSADSDQFGSSVPRRNYLVKGLLLRVPSNYDPEARTYAGIWDGSFKTAWSNNPAWVLYDLLTRPRYSTLARRLKEAQIDKWALYEAGKYCDGLVPDGFGGQEPRYVCNAYLTDMKQAGELLETLCSVFCGLPLWDGARFSVVPDMPADPVALYTNANVLDGAFSYGGAPLKSITTAVQVQYADKHDSYRAKTEYVADEAAVARYGLNIKQITAFGCDSRGQAVRFAQWTLQTALRQQSTVSFTVGREGLRHLPHDIVQIMDNDYAGAVLSGRLKSVSGKTLTLDAEVGDVAGAQLRWFSGGAVKSAKIVSRPKSDTVVLDAAPDIAAGGVWAIAGKVSPRLFRCVGIKENTDEGTYTITALLHDPGKYAAVDGAADFSRETHSLHAAIPALSNPVLQAGGGEVRLTWDAVDALSYDIKIYKDGTLYRHIPDADTPEIRLHNLANGRYRAEIRAKNARGALSEPLVKAWTLDYTITAVRTAAKTLAVDVTWTWPQTVAADIACKIWYGKTADLAKAAKLATLPYPQNGYTLTGVGAADEYWFWLRVIDNAGNTGEFTAAVRGASDPDPAPVVRLIHGQISESALSDGLKALIDGKAASSALDAEAKARAAALDAEAKARAAAVQAAAKKAADDLAAKARDLGTKITAVENVNNTQATQIQAVTAAQGRTAAGLEEEKTARADGIRAETQKREAAVSKLDGQVAGVVKSVQTLTKANEARAGETAALTTRMGQAEGSITQLKQSSITRGQVEAIAQSTVSARFQIPDTRNDNQPPTWYWTNYPKQTVTEFKTARALGLTGSVYAALETRVAFVDASGGAIFQTATLSNGKVWRRKSDTAHTYANGVYTYTKDQWTAWVQDETVDGAQAKADAVKRIAEAAQQAAQAAAADITEFKKIYATETKAEAEKRTTLETKLNGQIAQISSLKSAKADKSEVAAIARSALESRWLSAAEAAKTEALAAAGKDAQVKAATAALAAQTAAEKAAQTKADAAKTDAAKAAAVAQASGDAQSKADAAKLAAIADAAAKDAEVKRQAAADAKAKADKALADAKAYADGLNAAAEAKISRLEQTRVTAAQAEAIAQSTVSARFQTPDTRNDNQPPSWYWENYPRRTVHELKSSTVIGIGSGLSVVETTVPWNDPTGGYIHQTVWRGDGAVFRRKSDVAYTHATRTYTRDQWTDWVQDETVDGAQAKADAVKKIAEAAEKLAKAAAADIAEFKKTYATETKAEAEKRTTLETKLGQTTAKVEQTSQALTTLDGKVRGMYGIKAETIAGGRKVFAGLTLGADGQTGESEVLVWADKFAVVEPATKKISPVFTVAGGKVAVSGDDVIADGTVQGRHIAAGVKLITPEIVGAGGLFRLDKNGTVTMQSSQNKVGLKINGDAIEVYDEKGVLRVKMGRLA